MFGTDKDCTEFRCICYNDNKDILFYSARGPSRGFVYCDRSRYIPVAIGWGLFIEICLSTVYTYTVWQPVTGEEDSISEWPKEKLYIEYEIVWRHAKACHWLLSRVIVKKSFHWFKNIFIWLLSNEHRLPVLWQVWNHYVSLCSLEDAEENWSGETLLLFLGNFSVINYIKHLQYSPLTISVFSVFWLSITVYGLVSGFLPSFADCLFTAADPEPGPGWSPPKATVYCSNTST